MLWSSRRGCAILGAHVRVLAKTIKDKRPLESWESNEKGHSSSSIVESYIFLNEGKCPVKDQLVIFQPSLSFSLYSLDCGRQKVVDTWTFLFSQCLVATCWPPFFFFFFFSVGLLRSSVILNDPNQLCTSPDICSLLLSFFLSFLLVFQFDFVFLPSCWRLVYWITKFLLFLLISNIVKFRKNKSSSFPSTFCPFSSFSDFFFPLLWLALPWV